MKGSSWRVYVDQVYILPRNMFVFFTLLGLMNPSVNPVIYAARYVVFKRFLKQK